VNQGPVMSLGQTIEREFYLPWQVHCELDSHADTSVARSNFILLDGPTRYVDVHGYSPELKPLKNIPIATAVTAWVYLQTGQTYLLVLHECPNQLRETG
jgi:hypothetical protein